MSGSTASSAWPRPPELGLRLILAYALLIWLAQRYGRDCVEAMLPLFRALITSLDDHGRVLSVAIGSDGADTLVQMRVRLTEPLVVNGLLYAPTATSAISPTIGTGLILQPAIVAFGLILAWPMRYAVELPARFAAAVPMLALVLIADAPLSLWANYRHIVTPEPFSLLWAWEEFLVNGGRLALGLVIALAAIKTGGSRAFHTHRGQPV